MADNTRPRWGRKPRSLLGKITYLYPSSHYALLALFFFAGMEVSLAVPRWIILIISIILAITAVGIILIRTEEGSRFHPTQTILPALAASSVAAFALFLPTGLFLHIYFTASAILFFYLLKHGAKQAYPTWNWVISMAVLFVTLAAIIGWRFNLYLPIILILGLVFASIVLMSLQSIVRYSSSLPESWLIALSTGFILTELVWVMQFLPLHFMVQAGIVVTVYYVVFQLTTTSYERQLSKKDFYEYLAVGVGTLVALLSTARWT